MNPLVSKFEKFNRGLSVKNPPSMRGEDDITSFLRVLDASGEIGKFSEGDWIEFGKREGMSDLEIVELIEQAAGWVPNTDTGRRIEAAAWTKLS